MDSNIPWCSVIPVFVVARNMRFNRLSFVILVLSMSATSLFAGPGPQSKKRAPFAGQTLEATKEAVPSGDLSFSYKFEGPRFYLRIIEIDLGSTGTGELRFTRGESDEVLDSKVSLQPGTIARIRQLFELSDFLGSETAIQDKRDMSHLGWITIGAKQGLRERKVRYNFTTNPHIKELQDIFLGIAWQEIALFDIDNAERYQPLDLPKQLEILENDLKLERIAEPTRIIAPLKEIASDVSQPLIARNQAKRIVDAINQGKFKSPVKK
ncbi:MAG TPA: hypothetical protein VKN18_17185 [Blastocatellia bacterium]|nr:hypothetical protein [Blastocatellia bacterium]